MAPRHRELSLLKKPHHETQSRLRADWLVARKELLQAEKE